MSARTPKRGRARGVAEERRRKETDRERLLRRLEHLRDDVKQRPGYRTALKLLNSKYSLSSPRARTEILNAASFLISVLERIPL